MWRCEGPHCFVQKRPRPFVSALQSIAAVEASKNQLLRDFRYRSIFDFCNTICQTQTSISVVVVRTKPFALIETDLYMLRYSDLQNIKQRRKGYETLNVLVDWLRLA